MLPCATQIVTSRYTLLVISSMVSGCSTACLPFCLMAKCSQREQTRSVCIKWHMAVKGNAAKRRDGGCGHEGEESRHQTKVNYPHSHWNRHQHTNIELSVLCNDAEGHRWQHTRIPLHTDYVSYSRVFASLFFVMHRT